MRARGEGPRRHRESPADPGLPPAAHLRSLLARLQPPPSHGKYPRPVIPSPFTLPLQLLSFSLDVGSCACCFYYCTLLKTPSSHSHRCPPPTLSPSLSSPLKPQELARAPQAALASGPCRCCPLPRLPLWPSKLGSFSRIPLVLAPGPGALSSYSEKPYEDGRRTLSLGRMPSVRGGPFTVCGQGILSDFGKPIRHHSADSPSPTSPATSSALLRTLEGFAGLVLLTLPPGS